MCTGTWVSTCQFLPLSVSRIKKGARNVVACILYLLKKKKKKEEEEEEEEAHKKTKETLLSCNVPTVG